MSPLFWLAWPVAAVLALGSPLARADHQMEAVAHEIFGTVRAYRAEATPKGLILLLSDADGWTRTLDSLAWSMAEEDYVVAVIDMPAYRLGKERSTSACVAPAADLAALADLIESRYRLPSQRPPLLVGWGEGGAWAYAALAQATTGAFHAVVSLDFCPRLATRQALCQQGALASRLDGQETQLLPNRHVASGWFVFQAAPVCEDNLAEAFINQVASAKLVSLPTPAPEPGPASDDFGPASTENAEPLWRQQLLALLQWLDPNISQQVATTNADLDDLPLREVPVANGRRLVVLLSGDGGWAALDRGIAAALAARGVATVGWDSLSYFWRARTPDETAKGLARVLDHYLNAWYKDQVMLMGYSFGADVLPFLANRLPPGLQKRVGLIAFLGLSETASFEFHLSNWLGSDDAASGLPVAPEVARLDWARRVCVYGEQETDSPCPALAERGVSVIRMAGDHHFNHEYEGIVSRLLSAWTMD